MKHAFLVRFCLLSTLFVSLYSCTSKKEDYITEPLSDYFPLEVGKYITYRLDSLVFVDFERVPEIHRYQVKHVVDALVTDNLGRPSYRIFRYLRDSAGIENWVPNGSYFITPLDFQIEVVEDNLRFIKLHAPLRESYSWRGNKYLATDPYDLFGFAFSPDNDMWKWDYTYDFSQSPFEWQGYTYDNVYSVEQEDIADRVPIVDWTSYASRVRSVERYSKNIGLIYRDYQLWEYQPDSAPYPFYIGFGITMWMIDHN
jgi:hypothetical protein